MITKRVMADIVSRQRQALEARPQGVVRELAATLPYLTDRALLIGGVRGCGRTTLLLQLLQNDYPQAWYTDLSDPRLAGFDPGDFEKLALLVRDSGKGVLLLDQADEVPGWQQFVVGQLAIGMKVVATVSFDTWKQLRQAQGCETMREQEQGMGAAAESFCDRVILHRLGLFSYTEYLEATHKYGGEESVKEFLSRGAFPDPCRTGKVATLLPLYERIVERDVLIAKGVRDRATLARIALRLLSATGDFVTANALRNELKVKTVTTVTEHMEHLERAGLVAFVPIFSSVGGRRTVHPRCVYAVDGALAQMLSVAGVISKEKLFGTLIFNVLSLRYETICYSPEEGGCDFICRNEGRVESCVQTCYDAEDPDRMERKQAGLMAAMQRTGVRRGVIVTLGRSERVQVPEGEIELVDADTFLSR